MSMCLFSLQSVNATTISVHPGNSIQNAIDKASNGDTIVVYANKESPYTYKRKSCNK